MNTICSAVPMLNFKEDATFLLCFKFGMLFTLLEVSSVLILLLKDCTVWHGCPQILEWYNQCHVAAKKIRPPLSLNLTVPL